LGIGASCRRLARALECTRFSFRRCDFSLDHPNKFMDAPEKLSPPSRAQINILHLNPEELPKAIAYMPDIFTGAHNVAFSYVELSPPAPAQMLGLSLVDEVWGATNFIVETLAPFARTHWIGGSCDDVEPIGYEAARLRAYADFSPEDFIFLTVGDALSGVHRKNPLGAARAFLHAFPGHMNVRLVIKTHSVEKAHSPQEQAAWRAIHALAEADRRISVIDAYMDDGDHHALIEGANALVSLHRAEGLGYHLLEAMALGTPVVATTYSGNTDFCTEQTCFPVPATIEAVDPSLYPGAGAAQFWADPDHLAAVAQLRRVYLDDAARRKVAKAAREMVASRYSTESFARALEARLSAILKEAT
ncbi:MAG: glycosyltransferase, partial [Methylocystis sp.]|nr:glycosyltransferase [Methylocystis sp.]